MTNGRPSCVVSNGIELEENYWAPVKTMLVGICRLDVLAGRSDVRMEAISMSRCAGNVTVVRERFEGRTRRRAQRERADVHHALEVG